MLEEELKVSLVKIELNNLLIVVHPSEIDNPSETPLSSWKAELF